MPSERRREMILGKRKDYTVCGRHGASEEAFSETGDRPLLTAYSTDDGVEPNISDVVLWVEKKQRRCNRKIAGPKRKSIHTREMLRNSPRVSFGGGLCTLQGSCPFAFRDDVCGEIPPSLKQTGASIGDPIFVFFFFLCFFPRAFFQLIPLLL